MTLVSLLRCVALHLFNHITAAQQEYLPKCRRNFHRQVQLFCLNFQQTVLVDCQPASFDGFQSDCRVVWVD